VYAHGKKLRTIKLFEIGSEVKGLRKDLLTILDEGLSKIERISRQKSV
jgi:hypothetical protein